MKEQGNNRGSELIINFQHPCQNWKQQVGLKVIPAYVPTPSTGVRIPYPAVLVCTFKVLGFLPLHSHIFNNQNIQISKTSPSWAMVYG
jgi:hypothetical protein